MLEAVQVLETALNPFHMTSGTLKLSCTALGFFFLTGVFVDLREGLLMKDLRLRVSGRSLD